MGIPKFRWLLPLVHPRRVSVHALHTMCGTQALSWSASLNQNKHALWNLCSATYVKNTPLLLIGSQSRQSYFCTIFWLKPSHSPGKQNRYKLVMNWCHRSPPRSVFGTTSVTMKIFCNTHEAKTPCVGGVSYTLPGAATPLTLVLIHQLVCFAAPIFGRFLGFMIPFRHNHPELSDLNTTCHLNNHFQSKQLFDMAFYPHQLLKCSTHAYMWTKT